MLDAVFVVALSDLSSLRSGSGRLYALVSGHILANTYHIATVLSVNRFTTSLVSEG